MEDILSNIKDFVLQEEKDGLSLTVVVQHGCVSGIVNSLIYCKNEKYIFDNRKEISKRSIIKFDIDNICNKFNDNYKKILNENI